jgi:hypothetical protein
MPKGILSVQTAPADGRDQDYNDWYDNVHIPEILALAGFTSARRFKRADGQDDATPYLAIYEIEADDLQSTFAGLGAAMGKGELQMTDAMSREAHPTMVLYELISES